MGKTKTRVLHLVEFLYQGGIERLLQQMAKNNPEERQEVFFCAYEMEREEGVAREIREGGKEVFLFKKGKGFDFRLLSFLFKLIKERAITVVHTHDFGPMEYALFLKLRFPRLRLVHTQHSLYHFLPRKKYQLFFRLAGLFYFKVVAVSDHVHEALAASCPPLPWRRNRLTIYNGVDVHFYRHSETLSEKSEETKLRLLSLSRISPEKNLALALRTCLALKEKSVPFVFHHAGQGNRDQEERAKAYIRENGLASEVVLHGHLKDVRPLLTEGDIFLSCSVSEGHPLAVLEALAAGKICLCSDIPAHRNIAEKAGDVLLFFDLAQPQQLVEKLLELRKNWEQYLSLRKRGMLAVEKNFSLRGMMENYGRLYHQS